MRAALHSLRIWLAEPRDGFALAAFIAGASILGIAFLVMLCGIPNRYRKFVVMSVTFVAGLFLSLEFLLPRDVVSAQGLVFSIGAIGLIISLGFAAKSAAARPRDIRGLGIWLAMTVASTAVAYFASSLRAIAVPLTTLSKSLTTARPAVGDLAMIISSFAVLLGILNLFQIHGRAVSRRTQGWYNSAAFFVAFFAILIVGLVMDWRQSQLAHLEPGSPAFTTVSRANTINSNLFQILFRGFLTSLESTMFSLIAFYIVSAAYRAFRIKSAEAVLMMVAAVIIMLGLVPIGASITSFLPESGIFSNLRLERISYWLLIGPNMAVQRAIGFGIAVGALAMGLRIWLSLERGSFFDRQL